MDGNRFDALTRAMAVRGSRRRALAVFAGGFGGLATRLRGAPIPAVAQSVPGLCDACWATCDALNSPEGNALGCTIVSTRACIRARGPWAVAICGSIASTLCNYIASKGCPGACEVQGCTRQATNCDPVCQRPNEVGSCVDTCPGTRKCDRGRCTCPTGETPCGDVVCCGAGQCCRDGICIGPGACGQCMVCRAQDRHCVECARAGLMCDEASGRCRPCDLEGQCEALNPDTGRCVDLCAQQGQSCCPHAIGQRCYDPGECEECANGRVEGCDEGLICCGGSCINPRSDRRNCGGCGIDCGRTKTCLEGQCVCPITCEPPHVLDSETCECLCPGDGPIVCPTPKVYDPQQCACVCPEDGQEKECCQGWTPCETDPSRDAEGWPIGSPGTTCCPPDQECCGRECLDKCPPGQSRNRRNFGSCDCFCDDGRKPCVWTWTDPETGELWEDRYCCEAGLACCEEDGMCRRADDPCWKSCPPDFCQLPGYHCCAGSIWTTMEGRSYCCWDGWNCSNGEIPCEFPG